MHDTHPNNETNTSKLVTVAIHTYQKAQILQSLLQSQGIAATLHNVNTVQPVFSAGVRVRIAEEDLPRALAYIEDLQWGLDEAYDTLHDPARQSDFQGQEGDPYKGYVLIPVDFSAYTDRICRLGFNFAARRHLHVLLMHVYAGTGSSISITYQREFAHAESLMANLTKEIDEKIASGALPKVSYLTSIKEGFPADELLRYAKRNTPTIIIMGTRGKTMDSSYLIGSVAAEIIDSAKVPVLVIPEDTPMDDLMLVKNVGVATSFDDRDVLLFDQLMSMMLPCTPRYCLFNVSRSEGENASNQLQVIQKHYKEHYPNVDIEWSKLRDVVFHEALESFVSEHAIELIVVNTYKRKLLAQLFNPTMARRMLFHAGTPVLVMHSSSAQ